MSLISLQLPSTDAACAESCFSFSEQLARVRAARLLFHIHGTSSNHPYQVDVLQQAAIKPLEGLVADGQERAGPARRGMRVERNGETVDGQALLRGGMYA